VVPAAKPPDGVGTGTLVAVPVAEADAMAAPAVLVATSTSYAVWARPSACVYVQLAVGVMVATVPVGAVAATVGRGGVGVKADAAHSPQYAGVLALT